MAVDTMNDEAVQALAYGEQFAHAYGQHAMIGGEYILLGVLTHIELRDVNLKLRCPYGFVTSQMVMSRIVLFSRHSDSSDEVDHSECYERILESARRLSESAGSGFVGIEHLLHAILIDREDRVDSLAPGILEYLELDFEHAVGLTLIRVFGDSSCDIFTQMRNGELN